MLITKRGRPTAERHVHRGKEGEELLDHSNGKNLKEGKGERGRRLSHFKIR